MLCEPLNTKWSCRLWAQYCNAIVQSWSVTVRLLAALEISWEKAPAPRIPDMKRATVVNYTHTIAQYTALSNTGHSTWSSETTDIVTRNCPRSMLSRSSRVLLPVVTLYPWDRSWPSRLQAQTVDATNKVIFVYSAPCIYRYVVCIRCKTFQTKTAYYTNTYY